MKILEFFSKYQKLIIFGCLLLAALFFIDRALGVGTMFVFFLAAISLLLIAKCKEEKQRKVLGTLFLVVFSLHILFVVLLYCTHFQPFSGGGGDYTFYQQIAEKISERVSHINFSLQGIDFGNYYPVIVGYVYALTIPSMLIGQLLNAWFVALLIIFVYLIVREIGGTKKQGFWTGLIACFYPSLAFYGSLLLKDALAAMLCLIGLLLVLKIIKRFSLGKFVLLYAILIVLTNLRFYFGYAFILSFIISWMIFSNIKIKKRIIHGLIMLFFLGFLPMISCGQEYFGASILRAYLNIPKITFYREVVYAPKVEGVSANLKLSNCVATTPQTATPKPTNCKPVSTSLSAGRTSSVSIKTGFENPFSFLTNNLYSFVFVVLGPFPWQLTQLKHLLVLPEIFAWYFLFFFIIKGAIKSIKAKNKSIFPLIIFSFFIFGILALFISNFGITTRIRIPAFLSLLCLFPFGFKKLKDIKILLLDKIFE